MRSAYFLIFLADVIVFVLEYTTGMLGAWFNLGCAMCQLAKAFGASEPSAGGDYFRSHMGADAIHVINECHSVFFEGSYTFGALAKRLTRHLNAR